uniref:Uncharacterized protein n=1 Tax=Octopus bimaculoides TaxID=37653 RepID=A0A0L8GSM4_OCTBM
MFSYVVFDIFHLKTRWNSHNWNVFYHRSAQSRLPWKLNNNIISQCFSRLVYCLPLLFICLTLFFDACMGHTKCFSCYQLSCFHVK